LRQAKRRARGGEAAALGDLDEAAEQIEIEIRDPHGA